LTESRFEGRREDARFVTGRGRYTADHSLPDQVHGHFLRADRAHARIVAIDASAALGMDGVVGILTGADIVAAGLKSPPPLKFFKGVNGTSLHDPYRPALAHERVRFVGEPVALVLAESDALAQAAAEQIAIDYDDLPVAVDAGDALAGEALHADVPGNLAFAYAYGNAEAAEKALASAEHVVRVRVDAQRIAGNPMEPKSCLVRYEPDDDSFEIFAPTQGTSDLKSALAHVTGLPRDKFRIRSMDVGGAFGVRNEVYPEFIALVQAARQFGRAVKWTGTRSETISGDHHGRAAELSGELGLDAQGRFVGLRVEWLVNLGAYCSQAGPLINTVAAPTTMATSLYKIPAVSGFHRLVFTNTTPTTAYRGAGRPNVAYLLERLVDEAARVTGIDRIALRRKNVLARNQFPHVSPTGATYDSADPTGLLDAALGEADWRGFEKRRRAARKTGRLRGIGCALFLEPSGAVGKEEIRIEIRSDGRLALLSNAGPSGQGHETVFPALVAGVLGLPAAGIDLCYNDDSAPQLAGTGSFGSRSLISHGSALSLGAHEIVRKGRELAAHDLEVNTADLVFEAGHYKVAGTDLSISLTELIQKHAVPGAEHPLDTTMAIDTAAAYPSGAHIAEVEIDPDTGMLEILRYVAVDDCGTVYNPVIVEGQLIGGLMQGIGQVLGEHIAYDRDTGQLLSGTFMDYFMPRATLLPAITLRDRPVPSPANPLGAKGAGEAGATGSVPALANAVLDALRPLNVLHLDMPFTPSRIWQAIAAARTDAASEHDLRD
jgi:carbon-monoxide dehydrogenase large subunit